MEFFFIWQSLRSTFLCVYFLNILNVMVSPLGGSTMYNSKGKNTHTVTLHCKNTHTVTQTSI